MRKLVFGFLGLSATYLLGGCGGDSTSSSGYNVLASGYSELETEIIGLERSFGVASSNPTGFASYEGVADLVVEVGGSLGTTEVYATTKLELVNFSSYEVTGQITGFVDKNTKSELEGQLDFESPVTIYGFGTSRFRIGFNDVLSGEITLPGQGNPSEVVATIGGTFLNFDTGYISGEVTPLPSDVQVSGEFIVEKQ